MDLTETEWQDVELDSTGSGCGKVKAFVNTVINLLVTYCTGRESRRSGFHGVSERVSE